MINKRINQVQENYNLILAFIFLVIFSRLFVSFGLPKIFNHFHYLLIIICLFYYFPMFKFVEKKLLTNFILLNLVLLISSIFNNASIYNYIADTVIVLEPIIVLLIISSLSLTDNNINNLKKILLFFALINTLFAYYQYYIQGLRADDVHGIFINLGTAPHTAAAFNFVAAIILAFEKNFLKSIKILFIILFLSVTFLSSTLTLILCFFSSIAFFILIKKKKSLFKIIFYFLLLYLFILIIIYFVQDTQIYKIRFSEGNFIPYINALIYKYKTFHFISEEFQNFYNYLIGLGPGHSISRLSLMSQEYDFLNFTYSEIINKIFYLQQSEYLNNKYTGSSFFSLFYFAVGIYGDLGLIGTVLYYLFWLNIFLMSKNNYKISLLILNIIILSLIFQWLEEPAFINYVAFFIGLELNKILKENLAKDNKNKVTGY